MLDVIIREVHEAVLELRLAITLDLATRAMQQKVQGCSVPRAVLTIALHWLYHASHALQYYDLGGNDDIMHGKEKNKHRPRLRVLKGIIPIGKAGDV